MAMERCESCGREFACGVDSPDGCWCDELLIGPDRLAVMREHFTRCLCPDCLIVVAAQASGR